MENNTNTNTLENNENVKLDTILRTALLVLALINQVLTSTGHAIIPISDDQLVEFITLGFTIVTSLVAMWKNNSFTKNAIRADNFLAMLRCR